MKTYPTLGICFAQALALLGLSLTALAQVPFSDTFTGNALSPGWTLESPNPDSSYQLTGSSLNLTASWNAGGSDLYSGSDFNAPRLLQPVDPALDWTIETGFAFAPGDNYQGAGLLLAATNGVFTSQNDFARIAERAFYPNAGGNVIRAAGNYVSYSPTTSYLRVQKVGTSYTGWFSADGTNWTFNGTVSDATRWPYFGVFVIRYPWDGAQVDSTAAFSYFKVTASGTAPSVVLSIAPAQNAVILSWKTNLTGFTLQSRTNLLSGGWAPVAGQPTIIGTQNVLTNPTGGQACFYRLQHP